MTTATDVAYPNHICEKKSWSVTNFAAIVFSWSMTSE